mmetsp:Transcript_16496/g.24843  ORF Transcript_16496/g.24843 Transcript_16496/m.24843 type:complete len:173 (+) Transcript_16496:85-603(+)
MREFAEERDWNQFHLPRNLLLALVGEVGELSEIFQWKGEVKPGCPSFKEEERVHLGEELSDVLLYLIRLADRCNIDLASAVIRKMKMNAEKYPAKQARGRSDKYTAYNSKVTENKPPEEKDASDKSLNRTSQNERTRKPKSTYSFLKNGSPFIVAAAAVLLYAIIFAAVEVP